MQKLDSLFLSAFGFSFPALECFRLLSSFTVAASTIALFSFTALCTLLGTCRLSLTARTSFVADHRSTSFWRYSIACRSLVETGPSLVDACDFQIRTLPSSEAERTKSEVGV